MKRTTALNVWVMAVVTLLFAFGVYAIGWPTPVLLRYPPTLDDGGGAVPLTESGVRWMGAISITLAVALFCFSRGGKSEAK